MKRSDAILTVKAELPAYGGFSIARVNGSVLFIRNAIPGETVEVRIDEQKKDYAFASAGRILAASPDRTEPPCTVFGVCGGCQLQYISYPRQVSLKEEILLDCLKRIAKVEINLSKPIFHNDPWQYRHRGQFKIGKGSIGFFREKSRDVVDIEGCPLMRKEINDLFRETSLLFKSRPGLFEGISEVHISYADRGIALLKASSKTQVARSAVTEIASRLLTAGFCGVCADTGKGKPIYFGERTITFGLEGLKYTVSPRSFFQGHWRLNQEVVRSIRETLHPLKGKRIVDLYSGAGNFSLPLSVDAEEVIAVEENAAAIEDGKRNAELNGIGNCRFIQCPAERLEVESADVLVVDPPRPGLTNKVFDKIISLVPARIVYISCNPSTFARDIKKLLVRYEIESIRLIDFFPQTYHIESLAFLKLRQGIS